MDRVIQELIGKDDPELLEALEQGRKWVKKNKHKILVDKI